MNRVMVVVVAALAVLAGGLVWLHHSDDDPGSTGMVSGSDVTMPSVNDSDLGTVIVVYEDGRHVTVKAVPFDGCTFRGWFQDDVLVSETMIETFERSVIPEIVAVFGSEMVKSIELTWRMPVFASDGSFSGLCNDEVMYVSLDVRDYYASITDSSVMRHATYGNPMPTHLLGDGEAVIQICDRLEVLCDGMTNLQKATVIAFFVQDAIGYMSDTVQYGETEFWTTPEETVFSGYGDCEDTATLFVNIAAHMCLDVGFVAFEDQVMGHMSAAVALEDGEFVKGRGVFQVDGVTYAYVETAIDGMHSEVGQLTSAYRITEGNWTHVVYDPETEEYTWGSTVPIGTGTVTGAPMIYG